MKSLKNCEFSLSNEIEEFIFPLRKDINGRYKSWEHCRNFFVKHFNNSAAIKTFTKECGEVDTMALYLYYYLASWGMLRNSFLLHKDYRFLAGLVVEIINNKNHNYLLNLQIQDIKDDAGKYIDSILLLSKIIVNYFSKYTYFNDTFNSENRSNADKIVMHKITPKKVSETLVTKIIMGLYGVVPAYDRYFKTGIKSFSDGNERIGTFGRSSLMSLCKFVIDNEKVITKQTQKVNNKLSSNVYTFMKIIDMYFWKIGLKIENGNKQNV